MAVTVTPGKAPPVESLISPRIVPVAVWAQAGEASRVRPSKTAPAMNRYIMVDLRNTATFSLAPGPLYRLRQEPFTLRMTKGLVVAVENRSVVFQGAVGAFLASTAPAASTATTIDQ